jgi:hypothetical protein
MEKYTAVNYLVMQEATFKVTFHARVQDMSIMTEGKGMGLAALPYSSVGIVFFWCKQDQAASS